MMDFKRLRTDGEALRLCAGCAKLGGGKAAGRCTARRTGGEYMPIWAVPECDKHRKDVEDVN